MDALPAEAPAAEPAPAPAASDDAPSPTGTGPQGVPAQADPLRSLELWLVLLIGFGGALATSFHHWWYGFAHDSPVPGRDPLWSALLHMAGAAAAIGVLVYVLSRRGLGLRHLGLTLKWSDVAWTLALVAFLNVVPLVFIFAAALIHGFTAQWFFSNFRPPALRLDVLTPLLVVGTLCSAAQEELVVRAYMMTETLELTGSALLAVASSVAFQCLYHLYQGQWAALQHAPTFLVYALFYWKTRRATPVVLAHCIKNLLLDARQPL